MRSGGGEHVSMLWRGSDLSGDAKTNATVGAGNYYEAVAGNVLRRY